ncbi:MAG: DEAD/DEAH box helicase [Pseudomonadota bacterium]
MTSTAALLPIAPQGSATDGEFARLNLHHPVLSAIEDAGYERPTPIQRETIPPILEGRDVLGQAVTGSGKTAAFAWPLLSLLDVDSDQVQVLILAPTRELVMQTTQAVQQYGSHLPGFRTTSVYGGQSYEPQLRALRRGVHMISGTPGRVMDHMRRGSLRLGALRWLVLDEADEMLRMGFLEDIEWILSQTPANRQTLLFSATLPPAIRNVAKQHLNNPYHVTVKSRTATADSIEQRYVVTKQSNKVGVLSNLLEVEATDGVLVFVRTRSQTTEVANELAKAGHSAGPLNGDMPQATRERTIQRLRSGALDVVVATDVAARGLDVERISHVINLDFPHDVETYVHRIGRTGRAGRRGQAILFVTPRERRAIGRIESGTRQPLVAMEKPSPEVIDRYRAEKFKAQVLDAAREPSPVLESLVREICDESGLNALEVGAALAKLAQPALGSIGAQGKPKSPTDGEPRSPRARPANQAHMERSSQSSVRSKRRSTRQIYRVEVGRNQGVAPKDLVDAIAHGSDVPAGSVGNIRVKNDYSIIDLPAELPAGFFNDMEKVWLGGKLLEFLPDELAPKEYRTPKKGPAKKAEAKRAKHSAQKGKSKPKGKGKRKNRIKAKR